MCGIVGYTGSQGASGYTGSTGSTGYVGSQGVSNALYNYKAKVSTANVTTYPVDGYIVWNNATQTSATQININHTTEDNIDIDAFLAILAPTQTILIQDQIELELVSFVIIRLLLLQQWKEIYT